MGGNPGFMLVGVAVLFRNWPLPMGRWGNARLAAEYRIKWKHCQFMFRKSCLMWLPRIKSAKSRDISGPNPLSLTHEWSLETSPPPPPEVLMKHAIWRPQKLRLASLLDIRNTDILYQICSLMIKKKKKRRSKKSPFPQMFLPNHWQGSSHLVTLLTAASLRPSTLQRLYNHELLHSTVFFYFLYISFLFLWNQKGFNEIRMRTS